MEERLVVQNVWLKYGGNAADLLDRSSLAGSKGAFPPSSEF